MQSLSDSFVSYALKLILSKLDLKSQRHARLICKQWFDIINYSTFNFSALKKDELPSVVSVLRRYNKPISVRFKNLEQQCFWNDLLSLTKLTNITSLSANIIQAEYIEILTALTDLRSLNLFRKKSDSKASPITIDLVSKLSRLTSLSCVTLQGGSTSDVQSVQHLMHCKVLKNVDDVPINIFPALETLYLNKSTQIIELTGLTALTILQYKLHAHQERQFFSHLTTLTNLKHYHVNIKNSMTQFPYIKFPNLESLHMNFNQTDPVTTLKEITQLLHLTSLSLNINHAQMGFDISALTNLLALGIVYEHPEFQMDLALLTSLTQLTKLRVYSANWSPLNNIESVTKLTKLINLNIWNDGEVDYAENLTNLTKLNMHIIGNRKGKKYCLTKLTNLQKLLIDISNAEVRLSNRMQKFDTLTQLTRLELCHDVYDEDWNQVTKLVNLQFYFEEEFDGKNKYRFTDLTALKNLTSLNTLTECGSFIGCLYKLTKLQNCNFIEVDDEFLYS